MKRVPSSPLMPVRFPTLGRFDGRFWIVVPLVTILAYAALLFAEYQGTRVLPGKRWVSDFFDPGIYWKRAQFYPEGKTPYAEVFSEYPVIATLSFAIPLVIKPDLKKRPYRTAWSMLMITPFVTLLFVIQRARRDRLLPAWPIVLMASPTLLYFSLNRFDVLPALVCACSLLLFRREHYMAAAVLLGIGVHLKWYPAVIFPVYLAYHMQSEGLFENRLRGLWRSRSLRYTLAFVGTVGLLVLLCILAFGWDGFMTPYRFHGGRGAQYFNPYWLTLHLSEQRGWLSEALESKLNLIFLAAQLSIVWILLVTRIRSHREVEQYSILAIVLFITFARVDSPQWVLWYVPLALLFVRRTDTLLWIALLTLLNYLVFPLAFDHLGPILALYRIPIETETAFSWIVFAKDMALLAMMWTIMTREGDSSKGLEAASEPVPAWADTA